MAINTNDPRVSKEGHRILIDGIPVRVWANEIGITYGRLDHLQTQGVSITDIENKYKNKKKNENKKRTVQYLGKDWTIPELHREHCRKDITANALRHRIIERKWDIERALTEPSVIKRGYEIVYQGKTYASIGVLCGVMNVDVSHVLKLMQRGVSLEEAIERAASVVIPTVLYKGQQMRIMDLVSHSDNIHKLDYGTILSRIRTHNHSPEEALASPKKKKKYKFFTYKGKEYDSKKDLCVSLGIGIADYKKLSGIDPNTPEFIEMVDKFVASK